ncbi:MAG TPA: hypothetical protein VKA07_15675 [Candidatus Sulfotelmatobacter sp.]|nr:hypothetical protein [Candidatus Sulfotelmatobacter sp.]
MPVVIQRKSDARLVPPIPFSNEQELERALMEHPELLQDDNAAEGATKIAFVVGQLGLHGVGRPDLLFVTSGGLPIAVEVKLAANREARRQVVAQGIDYLSALASLTVDDLDKLVGGGLRQELQKLEGFERLWRSVGVNLREGNTRLVVALDDAPPGLEWMFRLLTNASNLDVQLLTVQQYQPYPDKGETIYVSWTRLSSASARRSSNAERPRLAELDAVSKAYNDAPNEAPAVGNAPGYRMVRIGRWPKYVGYQFHQKSHCLIISLYVGSNAPRTFAKEVAEVLSHFDGKKVGGGKASLAYENRPAYGKLAGLTAKFPLETPPHTVAAAMHKLINLTRADVDKSLKQHTSD